MESSRKSELAIGLTALVTLLILLTVHIKLTSMQATVQKGISDSLYISELASDIRYYDEVLSMSAQMAAQSGDAMGLWQQRHSLTSSMLDDTFRRTASPDTDDLLQQINAVNGKLVAIENLVFALVSDGEQRKATALLNSESYRKNKEAYTELHAELSNRLNAKTLSNRTTIARSLEESEKLSVTVVTAMVVLWAIVLSLSARWRRQMSDSRAVLTEQAHYDNLTGLANRTLFNLRLQDALAQSQRSGLSLALMIIDVDRFKEINDSYGHLAGDELLKTIASNLESRARNTDTVARLGGDEFALIATNIRDAELLNGLADGIVLDGQQKITYEKQVFSTGLSVGIALYPDDADNAQSLMQRADFALYQSKQAGRCTYRLFDQKLEDKVQRKKRMQEDMEQSLRDGDFLLNFQPLIDINSHSLKGVEVLLRWQHPELGPVPPDRFIPLAEESGLIIELGNWVLREACLQQVQWRKQGLGDIAVAVNLSSIQFQNPDLIPSIKQIVLETGMSPGKLELEITESGLMDKGDSVVELLAELNEFGLKLAIDDFGTGYSSLAYLKHFPVHHLKIDRAFVNELPHNKDDAAIARSIINMAHIMKLKVVAEGVETNEQLKFLRRENCDYAQGYHISRPLSAADFSAWHQQQYGGSNSVVRLRP